VSASAVAAVRPRISVQVARFLVVGGIATAVDVGLFNLLHVVGGVGPVLAKTLSTVAGAIVAFIGNRQWSFAGRHETGLGHQVSRYIAVNLAALGLAVAPVAVARSVLHLDGVLAMNVAANVVGLGMATAFRFYGYRRWVFRHREASRPAGPAPGTEQGPGAIAPGPSHPHPRTVSAAGETSAVH
jgi:putative flippase GtrA